MGNHRMIYIQDDELNNRLKNEENVSALIIKLLKEYYTLKGDSVEEKKNVLLNLEATQKREIEIIEKQKEEIVKSIQKQEEVNKTEQEILNRKLKIQEQFKNNVKNNFREEMKREMTDREYNSFKELWDADMIQGVYDFCNTLKSKEMLDADNVTTKE